MKYGHVNHELELVSFYDDDRFLFPPEGLYLVSLGRGCVVRDVYEDVQIPVSENEYVVEKNLLYHSLDVLDWKEFLLGSVEMLFYASQVVLTREFPSQERDTWGKIEAWAESALNGDQMAISKIQAMMAVPDKWQDYVRAVLARRDFYENFIVASRKSRADAEAFVLSGQYVGQEMATLEMFTNETRGLIQEMLGVTP